MIQHNERCPKCKKVIKKLLEKIYGKVEENYKFEIKPYLENFRHSLYFDELKEIYESLQNYRNFKEFVKTKSLPRCDFFVPNPGFIVEFDESQHFTFPRKITLEHYPKRLKLGFDRERWISLCKEIKAQDNDPPYRDEQRTWYDSLRDFLPILIPNQVKRPTIRLFAKDLVWCSLDPNNQEDVNKFKEIIEKNNKDWKIKTREDSYPFFVARIIITREWNGKPEEAKRILEGICEKWPGGKKVKFLITCGGFIQFSWPKTISKEDIGDNKNTNQNIIDTLVVEAERCSKSVLNGGLKDKLKELTDYITLGVDSRKEKISITKNYIRQPHIELVSLVDLKDNKFYWTGKSYPTSNQQEGLIRISNLKTHFRNLEDIGKVMILGCHDLNIFNPRSKNAKGWRKKINEEFKELAKRERPIYVLHHPHTTVKKRTWLNAWSHLKEILPSVRHYAGAGRYFESSRKRSEYDALNEVLKSTKFGNTIDFIV